MTKLREIKERVSRLEALKEIDDTEKAHTYFNWEHPERHPDESYEEHLKRCCEDLDHWLIDTNPDPERRELYLSAGRLADEYEKRFGGKK